MLRKLQSIMTDGASRIPGGGLIPGASARGRYNSSDQ
jgi:hypothetical protein